VCTRKAAERQGGADPVSLPGLPELCNNLCAPSDGDFPPQLQHVRTDSTPLPTYGTLEKDGKMTAAAGFEIADKNGYFVNVNKLRYVQAFSVE
jgi:hypothetical protein